MDKNDFLISLGAMGTEFPIHEGYIVGVAELFSENERYMSRLNDLIERFEGPMTTELSDFIEKVKLLEFDVPYEGYGDQCHLRDSYPFEAIEDEWNRLKK